MFAMKPIINTTRLPGYLFKFAHEPICSGSHPATDKHSDNFSQGTWLRYGLADSHPFLMLKRQKTNPPPSKYLTKTLFNQYYISTITNVFEV